MSCRRVARVSGAVALALCAFAAAQPARAELSIDIDKTHQRMTVALDREPLFVWPVSTGAAGYDTPSGTFTPFRMEKDHFSREWDDAPMPHSVFFTMNGHAIHGSYQLKAMGTPASHGCVRLEPKNAKILFDLVRQQGMKNTRVSLFGEAPGHTPQVARRDGGYDIMADENVVASVPQRRRVVVQEYRERPRGFYFSDRPYYHRPQYGYAPPPPFFFGR
jgi:hypothetical protein